MARRFSILTITFLFLAAAGLMAQDRGTFVGTVMDPTSAVVPNVNITITNVDTNAVYHSQTNEVGQYRVPNLPIGVYQLKFEAAGFKTAVRDAVRLSVTDVLRIDVTMEVGLTSESITVEAAAPLLTTETPEVGTLMGTQQVINLPLGFAGGRNPETFAYKLTPGVQGNSWESRINGSPAFAKEVVLDGASATVYIGGHFSESQPPMEALAEFKVQTSGMSAEYTRTGGGVFNFVMKSGTNAFHGSAFGQIHNEWMDANTFANNYFGRSRLYDRRHEYGFSVGGPIYIPKVYNGKDKWFFYTAFEHYEHSFAGGGSPTVTVPLPEWWNGDFSNYLTGTKLGQDALGRDIYQGMILDPTSTRFVGGQMVRDQFPGNKIPADQISRVSKNLAEIFRQHYMPQVKGPDGNFVLINNSFFPVSNTGNYQRDQFSVKSDYYLSTAHKLSGMFSRYTRPRVLFDQGGVWDFNDPEGGPLSRARVQPVDTHFARIAYDWTVSPTMLNHFLVGFNRQINPSQSLHLDEPGGQILGIDGIGQDSNYPQISFGSSDRVNFPTVGYLANDMGGATAWEVLNTFSWIKGKHSVKFGFNWRFNGLAWRVDNGPASFNFGSDVTGLPGFAKTGHSFASMLLGMVNSASVPVDTPTQSAFNMWSWFVQDDWKITPRLTLNLGLRWDYQPPQTEKYDRLHNFNPNVIDPQTGLPGAIEYLRDESGNSLRRRFFDPKYNHFGPRIGLAFAATDRMTFRAGYGIFYHGRIPNGWSGVPWGSKFGFQTFNNVNQPAPATAAFNWDDGYRGNITQSALNPSLANTEWGPVHWDSDVGRVGYTQQWNANIQFQVARDLVADVGYVGSQSTGIMNNELKWINQLSYDALALGDTLGQWIDRQGDIPAAAVALGARYPFKSPGSWMPVYQTLQPFPQVPYWSNILAWGVPTGFNTYHSMQLQLNKRYSNGLQFTSSYILAKTIDNVNSAFGDTWGMNSGRPLDYYNLSLEKSISDFDQTHVVKIGAGYEIPFGRGRKWGSSASPVMNAVLGGWTIQYIGNYFSGAPLGFGATGTPNTNFRTNRAVMLNPQGKDFEVGFNGSQFDMSRISTSGTSAHKYFDTSLMRDVDRYERGNASRRTSQLRQPWILSDDFGLQKNFSVKAEQVRIQLRMEMLNAFNRHRFTGINTSPSSPLFGQVTGVSNDRRQIQFGIRADW